MKPGNSGRQRRSLWQGLFAGLVVVFLAGLPHVTLADVPRPPAKPGGAETEAEAGAAATTRGFPAEQPAPGSAGPVPVRDGVVYLVARLTDTGAPLDSGIVWRIFNETGDAASPLSLLESATGGEARFRLPAGEYVVHAAYGRAGQSKRVRIDGEARTENLVLNAGGLRLSAAIAEDLPISASEVTYDIFHRDEAVANGREVIAANARSGEIYRLNAGTYEVVSRYGDVNAEIRAEITVRPGELTDATIYHRAAEVTLKLVNEPGGEALANTAWSILADEGAVVFQETGAFPTVILAEGAYNIVAKHEIGTFTRRFSVEAGHSRDVEVLTVTPEAQ